MTNTTVSKPTLSEEAYKALKPVALVWLPALATLYFAVAGIWHLPNANEVVGTITAVDLFLGTVLNISANRYNNSDNALGKFAGDLNVVRDVDGGQQVIAAFNGPPEQVLAKPEVTMKVNQVQQ